MSKYFKNFLLCGDVEHYCLLCQEVFYSIPDVEKHIRWEIHRKRIKSQGYLPKFRKDLIYKLQNHFYCEICNFVASDMATLTEHLNNETHIIMKKSPKTDIKNFVGVYHSGYTVIKNVILNKSQWNSIVDKKCLLCNILVEDIEDHTASEDHIIKLIKSETKYDNERYYRKINDDKYHCFTCKVIYSEHNFNNHWPKCKNIDEIEIRKLKEAGFSKMLSQDLTENAILQKRLIETVQDCYYIEEKTNVSICKYCRAVVAIDFKTMILHIKSQHDKQEAKIKKSNGSDESSEDEVVYREVADNGKRRSELAKYGRTHSIKLNSNGSKGWCLICDKYMSAHKNVFKQHIKGGIHRAYLELLGLKSPKKRSPRKYKSKNISQYRIKYVPLENAFSINDDYCIDAHSFFLLHPILDNKHFEKTKCFACNELFPQGQEGDHCKTETHRNNFMSAKVVEINEKLHKQAFTREIRKNLFHCGFCNQTCPFFDNLASHLTNLRHASLKVEKTSFRLHSVDIMSEGEDPYLKLVEYGFGAL